MVVWKVHRTFQAKLVAFWVASWRPKLRSIFLGNFETSKRFCIEICYVERGQCCPTIYLTPTKQRAKKKGILVLNWNSESISKHTLSAMLMLEKSCNTCPYLSLIETMNDVLPFPISLPRASPWLKKEAFRGIPSFFAFTRLMCHFRHLQLFVNEICVHCQLHAL